MILSKTYQTSTDFLERLIDELVNKRLMTKELATIYKEAYVSGMPNPFCTMNEDGDIETWSYLEDLMHLLGYTVVCTNSDITVFREYPPIRYSTIRMTGDEENTVTLGELVNLIEQTEKPFKYTYDLGYRNPITHNEPRTREEILDIIKSESIITVTEHKNYIHVNAYSANDIW